MAELTWYVSSYIPTVPWVFLGNNLKCPIRHILRLMWKLRNWYVFWMWWDLPSLSLLLPDIQLYFPLQWAVLELGISYVVTRLLLFLSMWLCFPLVYCCVQQNEYCSFLSVLFLETCLQVVKIILIVHFYRGLFSFFLFLELNNCTVVSTLCLDQQLSCRYTMVRVHL